MKSIENQATGTTESEVINDLSMKTGLTLVAGDLSSQEDILECISCKSVRNKDILVVFYLLNMIMLGF